MPARFALCYKSEISSSSLLRMQTQEVVLWYHKQPLFKAMKKKNKRAGTLPVNHSHMWRNLHPGRLKFNNISHWLVSAQILLTSVWFGGLCISLAQIYFQLSPHQSFSLHQEIGAIFSSSEWMRKRTCIWHTVSCSLRHTTHRRFAFFQERERERERKRVKTGTIIGECQPMRLLFAH